MTKWAIAVVAAMVAAGCAEPPAPGAESASAEAASVRMADPETQPITLVPGTTTAIVEGTLPPNGDASFLLGEEAGSILLAEAHAPAYDGDLTVSVHRGDTGVALSDGQPNPAFWIARLPETLGYLVVVHGTDTETEYALEVEVPRELQVDPTTRSAEVTSAMPPHGIVAYILPPSSALTAELTAASDDAYLTVHALDGQALLAAEANARSFSGDRPIPDDEVVLRVHQGAETGEFTLGVTLE